MLKYFDGFGHLRKVKYTKTEQGKKLLLVMSELIQDQHGNSYEDDQIIGLDVQQLKEVIKEMEQ